MLLSILILIISVIQWLSVAYLFIYVGAVIIININQHRHFKNINVNVKGLAQDLMCTQYKHNYNKLNRKNVIHNKAAKI